MSDTSRLLDDVGNRVAGAEERLFAHVYDELLALARGKMAREAARADLNPSDIVGEAFLKLCGREAAWENRRHFFGAAARAMHQVLVDQARARNAAKRGGGQAALPLDDRDGAVAPASHTDTLDIALALVELEQADPRAARVVRLRVYAGLTLPEIAQDLGVSERTVSNDWAFARAWLFDRLKSTNE
ncbi:MAG: sigma-70 family RNA polymerase sigma factor [Phycisphaerales bacterium]|nr:sigma-70 family RNA polymerase sigma factor [Phycisphaerales bacterium]